MLPLLAHLGRPAVSVSAPYSLFPKRTDYCPIPLNKEILCITPSFRRRSHPYPTIGDGDDVYKVHLRKDRFIPVYHHNPSTEMVEQSLALQAVFACLAGGGTYISSRDPSNDRRPKKGKEPKDRVFELREMNTLNKVTAYVVWRSVPLFNLAQGAYLAYLAYNPTLVRRFNPAYAIPFFACSVIGPAWRYWCFRTLDRYFTFRLQVQEGQKLIETGPYRFLAHPSYLGHVINCIGVAGATFGPFNVFLNSFSLKPIRKFRVPAQLVEYVGKWIRIRPRSLAQAAACVISALLLRSFYKFNKIRIADEEAMMKAHFGKEYDEFLAKRWRIVPFVY